MSRAESCKIANGCMPYMPCIRVAANCRHFGNLAGPQWPLSSIYVDNELARTFAGPIVGSRFNISPEPQFSEIGNHNSRGSCVSMRLCLVSCGDLVHIFFFREAPPGTHLVDLSIAELFTVGFSCGFLLSGNAGMLFQLFREVAGSNILTGLVMPFPHPKGGPSDCQT